MSAIQEVCHDHRLQEPVLVGTTILQLYINVKLRPLSIILININCNLLLHAKVGLYDTEDCCLEIYLVEMGIVLSKEVTVRICTLG